MSIKKKFVYSPIIILAVIIAAILLTIFKGRENQKITHHISTIYAQGEQLIHAYPKNPSSQFLSESVGLYMDYLLLIKDSEAFDAQVSVLEEAFIVRVQEDYFIRWALDHETSANALIDDMRIIAALNKGAQMFNKPAYKELGKTLSMSIENRQMNQGIYADYVEWTFNEVAPRTTLSYLTPDFFGTLMDTDRTKELLLGVGNNEVFFPEYYDIEQQAYQYAETAHMVDQLLIAINREHLKISSPDFEKWMVSEWKANKYIAGQYDRRLLKSSVGYESLAVYAYLYEYFKLTHHTKLAIEVKKRVKTMVRDKCLDEAHFFDYILYEKMIY